MRQNVFEKRNKPDPLVEADVVNISAIVGKGKKITNLPGLEKCKSLAQLELANNEIADLAPIKELKLIQSVNRGQKQDRKRRAARRPDGIQYIGSQDNQIADLSPAGEDHGDGVPRSVEQPGQGHFARSPG